MKRLLAGCGLIFVLLSVALPVPAHATGATFFGPIVPAECHCTNQPNPESGGAPISTAPDFGCVLQTIQNALNFAITIGCILFVIYLAYAGFRMMVAGNASEMLSQARSRLLNVVIGIVIVLCAWLIVDYVMKTLYNDAAFGPWNAILAPESGTTWCIVAKKPMSAISGSVASDLTTTPASGGTGTAGTGTGGAPGGGGDRCTTIPDSQLTSIGGSFKLVPDAARRFLAMKDAAAKDGVTLTVTSAYRSPDDQLAAWNGNGCKLVNGKAVCDKYTAAVPCSLGGSGSNHSLGTAVDISSSASSWLRAHGGTYGFYNNLPQDPVHWSDTGR